MIDILDPERKIPSILESEIAEMEKLYYIQERVNLLEQQGVIQNKFEEPHND
jgi:putative FHA domain protein